MPQIVRLPAQMLPFEGTPGVEAEVGNAHEGGQGSQGVDGELAASAAGVWRAVEEEQHAAD
jgi:hypothetical protein